MKEKKTSTTKNHFDVKVDTNAISDQGEGIVRFKGGLTLSDESEQVNGTRYDHSTTDISNYTGEVFADHGGPMGYQIDKLIGTMFGVSKQGSKIVAEGIKYAMRAPLGRLAHDLMVDGVSKNFSIGSTGDEPDKEGVYRNHSIYEVSQVGLGNNLSARAGELIANSLDEYEKDGMDVTPLRKLFTEDIKTNSKGDSMEDEKKDDKSPTAADDSDKKEEKADEEAPASEGDTTADDDGDDAAPEGDSDGDEDGVAEKQENAIKQAVKNAVQPLQKELKRAKQAFDDGAKEPEWQISDKGAPVTVQGKSEAEKQYASMEPYELAGLQVLNFYKADKSHDSDAAKTLRSINEYNLKRLKEEKMVKNVLTLSDFDNFVISPELMTEIEGYRSDFSEVLRAFPYQQTNSRDFSWLTRSGDISFGDVDGIDDAVGTDTLKPVSEYSASSHTSRLQELAAVTPICSAAQIFAAADLIADATQGYRTEYDRRLAQLPIARLEQAMESGNSNTFAFDSTGSDTNAQKVSNIRRAIFSISQGEGNLVMSEASWGYLWDLLTQLGAANSIGETIVGDNPARRLWGKSVIVAPNELLPTLDDSSTYRTITEVRPQAGGSAVSVTVNHAIFYVASRYWKGRVNGGLRFDLSTEAAYEVGGTVYSAYQRNEVVLRGSMFRGGAITDPSRVAGLRAEAVIS